MRARRAPSAMMTGRGARYSATSVPMPLPSHQSTGVPEVDAGYYWEAANTVGFGTTAFRVLEGNGHSTFDLVQATVANQPTALTENGGAQFRMRKTGDAVGASILGTVGDVTAGWTGQTYIAGWFRLPDASGAVGSTGTSLFVHSNKTGNFTLTRTQVTCLLTGGTQKIRLTSSTNGTAGAQTQWGNPFTGAWIWLEAMHIAAATAELDVNFALQTRLDANGLFPLFDTTAPISVGCNRNFGIANAETTDWAACYYANGIPSLANRVRLANRANPTGILLVA